MPPYSTGTLNGQAPVETGFSASSPWTEQDDGTDDQVSGGGLTVSADGTVSTNGTVAAVSGGTGRVVGEGNTSHSIHRTIH
jgi:hypothetical protein